MTPRERFRTIVARNTCTPVAPIFDPLSARIADMLGWEVVKLSGSVGKFANLAVPDGLDLSNISDLVDVARRITRVCDACLVIDADHGGGNALNVMRTVRELEQAGVCAIEIEDNLVPTRFADVPAPGQSARSRHSDIISMAEQVGKLEAAVAARRDPATMIVARTSAMEELPLDEALARIRAYSDTGAEAIMFPKLPNGRATIEAARSATRLPIFALGVPADAVADPAYLASQNVSLRFLGQAPYAMAVKAIYDAFEHLKGGGAPEDLKPRQASADVLRALDRTGEFRDCQQRFVRD